MPSQLITPEAQGEVFHQFARLQSMTTWWHWLVLLAVCLVVVLWATLIYRRDALEMALAKRWTLLGLRVAAFVGILMFFLDLERRSQSEVVENSRAVILIDTSLSMGIQDSRSSVTLRRIDQVVDQLSSGQMVRELRQNHDVVVYRFGESEIPAEVASLQKIGQATAAAAEDSDAATATAEREVRFLGLIAGGVMVVALLALVVHLIPGFGGRNADGSWALLLSIAGFLVATVFLAVANLRHPEINLATTFGLLQQTTDAATAASVDMVAAPDAGDSDTEPDWKEVLAPRGGSTRLGDALRFLVAQEHGTAVAAFIVISDGRNNAGVTTDEAIQLAKRGQIPIFAIGIGGVDRPQNVRVVDVEAPLRVYPGDSFTLNGYIQSHGLAGETVKVQLHSFDDGEGSTEPLAEFEGDISVRLREDSEPVSVRFEVTPREQGTRRYQVSVVPPEQDTDFADNARSAKVQIVARKNRVLLMAGGPTREYRFLRDLLYRDRDTELDVLLQTAVTGISQESDRLLTTFPATPTELFEYDCLVAFDPDWLALEEHVVDLVERWVADEAGGLVVVAGPVHTPQWSNRRRNESRISTIRGLYPVIFYSRGSASIGLGRFSSMTPWPLQFTQDGKDAEFLWLGDDVLQNVQAWDAFEGVYGYYAVKDPKPGARVYSRFSDPTTAIDGDLPIYMAGHFYGAGRVFFQASGEMWRIRSVNDAHFEQYYTKLIRWASQGRLLRDSSRGVLLVDKSRCLLGDHVSVRAILTDAQHNPLSAEQVAASLVIPNGSRQPLVLRRLTDATHGGMFSAQFTALLEGDYRIELQPPHGDSDELLVREVRARIPALETEQPERNDALLQNLAEQTGGQYFIGFKAALGGKDNETVPVHTLLQPQDRISYVASTPDKEFERILMTWLLGIICGALCLEWLIRRLNRLA